MLQKQAYNIYYYDNLLFWSQLKIAFSTYL